MNMLGHMTLIATSKLGQVKVVLGREDLGRCRDITRGVLIIWGGGGVERVVDG